MTVYLVYETDFDTTTVIGVFSSEDKAIKRVEELYAKYLANNPPKHDKFWVEAEEVQ